MGETLRISLNILESAKIAKEKIFELWELFPLLKREIVGEGNFGGDYASNLAYVSAMIW